MGLFKRNKKVEIPNKSSYDIELNLKESIEYAAELGIKLNYSNESITRLDAVLMIYYEDFKKYNEDVETCQNTAKIFGTYLGEVIRRNWLFEYKWTDYNGVDYRRPVLEKEVEELVTFMIDPVDEVLKRMQNGEDYSVYKYFREIQEKVVKHNL